MRQRESNLSVSPQTWTLIDAKEHFKQKNCVNNASIKRESNLSLSSQISMLIGAKEHFKQKNASIKASIK